MTPTLPTILIADNTTWREDAARFLQRTYNVKTASDSLEAADILKRKGCDLAIIDRRLSNEDNDRDISGILLAKHSPEIPKIIVSAYPSPEYEIEEMFPENTTKPAFHFVWKGQGLNALSKYVAHVTSLATVRDERKILIMQDTKAVFVVYGRNEHIRKALFEYLRAIGLQPIEWTQALNSAAQGSPYIGDILDAAFARAQAVIVLLTPDDEARLKSEFHKPHDPHYEVDLSPQARPNVLFEAGMALGRFPDRTVLVQIGMVRPFSDISGRYIVQLDNEVSKRQLLAHQLEKAGCQIDLKGFDWHTAGDFTI